MGTGPSHQLQEKLPAPHTEYLNLIPGLSPFSTPDHASSLPTGSLGPADIPGAVVQNIEVSSEQDVLCDPPADQSESSEDSTKESASEEIIEVIEVTEVTEVTEVAAVEGGGEKEDKGNEEGMSM